MFRRLIMLIDSWAMGKSSFGQSLITMDELQEEDGMMKGLLIQVGADTSGKETLGVCAPVFEDRTFEFIPIVERCDTSEKRTYRDLPARHSEKRLMWFLPAEYEEATPHYDPDPENFTYSEPINSTRGKQLKKLEAADYLFFVASLVPYSLETHKDRSLPGIRRSQSKKMAKYLVGYYRIDAILDVDTSRRRNPGNDWFGDARGESLPPSTRDRVGPQLLANAHSKRLPDDQFLCAVGVRDRASALLKKGLRITEQGAPFRPTSIGRSAYGEKSFPRGFKWIGDGGIQSVLAQVQKDDQ